MGYRGMGPMGNGAQGVWGTRGMGHMGNGVLGVWRIWAMRPTGGMGHMGNRGRGMGYKGYGPCRQWDTWAMGYRGMGHMGDLLPKYQKDVKLSKRCQVSKKMSNVKNSNT